MGHMNDFFGEPLFKPTGTDWIDHAFTAAVLDDMEREEKARKSFRFAAGNQASVKTGGDDCTICTIYGKKYDLLPVFPFEPRSEHGEAVAMIERITGLSHGDAMKLEIRICQLGFIPLEYPDPS